MKSEELVQQEIVASFNNEMPHLRGTLCYNLNNSVGAKRGRENKFKGLIAGRSDLVFYFSGTAHMIELKNDVGIQKKDQKEWQEVITAQGFPYVIIRSLEEFWDYVMPIIKNG
jgi:hypothetical protein